MILQNLDAVSEKTSNIGFCHVISYVTRGDVLDEPIRRVAKSPENRRGDDGERVFGKTLDGKYNGHSLLHTEQI